MATEVTEKTTYQHSYLPLGRTPGYTGYTPGTKYGYGETFGNTTARYMLDYRHKQLNTSRLPCGKGGDKITPFPTVYRDARLIVGTKDRSRERWLLPPKYHLMNEGARKDQILDFDKLAQQHREWYRDKTGTVERVNRFVAPTKHRRAHSEQVTVNVGKTETSTSKALLYSRVSCSLPKEWRASQRERSIRDIIFENRFGTF
jgi:hypothetical protein